MESRKRPFPDTEDAVVTKKRILTGTNGSPLANGCAESDENEDFRDRLETYRKDAIYRRMMHYSREYERSVAHIQELEHRKNTCEASIAAISACWSQLVETIRLIVKTDDLPDNNLCPTELFNLSTCVDGNSFPEFNAALGDTVNATQALITKFVQLSDHKLNSLQIASFTEQQELKNEVVVLRSEVDLLRAKLRDSETKRDSYHNALVALENRLERSQSAIVHEVESKGKSQERECEDMNEEALRKPPSPLPSDVGTPIIQTNGYHDPSSELQVLQEQLKTRDAQIVELENDAAVLRDEKAMMQLEFKAPSHDQLLQNPTLIRLLDHIAFQELTLTEKAEENKRLAEELHHLQSQLTSQAEVWETDKADFEQTINDLAFKVEEKGEDIARLRMQRDRWQAEVNERRAKDSVKLSSLQEYKSLLESNSERVAVLQSELRRCKAHLAATSGSEDLLNFFLGGNHDEIQFFQVLKEDKAQLETRVCALEETLTGFDSVHPEVAQDMRLQVDALQRLSKVSAELQKYQQAFGDLATQPPEVAQLVAQLQQKEAERGKLQLVVRELEANQTSIYSELDQLALQWESLDKQVKNKVFGLHGMEERLSKSVAEKAKADTKYFEAVKAHQAAEAERKSLQRAMELQAKVVSSLESLTPKLQQQINNLEAECTALRKGNTCLQDRVKVLERDNPDLKVQLEHEKKRVQELTALFNERENFLQMKRKELRLKEDDFIRFKKDSERQTASLKREAESQRNQNKPGAVETELENLRTLLRCSICRGPARSTVITKCMHTFCKGCVDSRLSTRQRKCPACNIPFGASDVHTFFFQ